MSGSPEKTVPFRFSKAKKNNFTFKWVTRVAVFFFWFVPCALDVTPKYETGES